MVTLLASLNSLLEEGNSFETIEVDFVSIVKAYLQPMGIKINIVHTDLQRELSSFKLEGKQITAHINQYNEKQVFLESLIKSHDVFLDGFMMIELKTVSPLDKVLNRFTKIQKTSEHDIAVPLTIPGLIDALNAGFKKAGLYLITGNEYVGKTAMLVSIANNLALRRSPSFNVGILSLDLSPERWMERVIANTTDIPIERISIGDLCVDEMELINNGAYLEDLKKLNINSSCSMTVTEIEKQIKEWVKTSNMRIVFIDSLQHIQPLEDSQYRKNISICCKSLKRLAQELQICMVATLTLNNTAKHSLKDIRKLGAIEEHADVILNMHRPSYFEHQFGETKISVLKNNYGKLGSFDVKMDLQKQGFEILA